MGRLLKAVEIALHAGIWIGHANGILGRLTAGNTIFGFFVVALVRQECLPFYAGATALIVLLIVAGNKCQHGKNNGKVFHISLFVAER